MFLKSDDNSISVKLLLDDEAEETLTSILSKIEYRRAVQNDNSKDITYTSHSRSRVTFEEHDNSAKKDNKKTMPSKKNKTD